MSASDLTTGLSPDVVHRAKESTREPKLDPGAPKTQDEFLAQVTGEVADMSQDEYERLRGDGWTPEAEAAKRHSAARIARLNARAARR